MGPFSQRYRYIFYIFIMSLYHPHVYAAGIKAVAIEFLDDQSQTITPGLKAQYDLCVQLKQTLQKTKREHPQIWSSMEKTLKPGYDVDAKPDNEPDWVNRGVGKNIHKEYFYGNLYANFKQLKKYIITEDGHCTLLIKKSESREIDNGKERYLIKMKGYITSAATSPASVSLPPYNSIKVSRYPSPVVIRLENDLELSKLVNEQPGVIRYLNTLLDSGANRTPGTNPGISQATIDILRETFGIKEDKGSANVQMPRANDEHFILGHACDIVSSSVFKTRQWYYKPMHYYPSIMRRAIILKSESTFGSWVAVKEATRFQILDELSDAIFIPPRKK